jgi:iron complex outermembrane receptor protein
MSKTIFAAITLALAVIAEPTLAQSNPPTTSSPVGQNDDTTELQEIQVFAQKRTESLQNVPIAVTAVSAAAVGDLRLDTTNNLQEVVPNLTIGSVYAGVVPQLTMRGVGVNDGLQTTSPSVGTYIDQVYIEDSAAAVLETFGVDRIEVLRGPQGTLYGRNPNGGAINFYTQHPTNDFQGEVVAEAGNYDEHSGSGSVSGPLFGSTLTGIVSAYYKDRNGYGVDLAPGPTYYTSDQLWAEKDYDVRTELLFKPFDDMQWLVIAAKGQNKITYGWPVIGLRNPANPAVDCANPFSTTAPCVDALGEHVYGAVSPYSTIQKGLSYTIPTTTFGSLQGTWTLDPVELTSITGYVHNSTAFFDWAASDYVGLGLYNFSQPKHSDEFSEEFRVASKGNERFNYTTGLYASTFTLVVPQYFSESGALSNSYGERTSTNYAAFGQADYAITSKFTVTGGLRYSKSDLDTGTIGLNGKHHAGSDEWGSIGGRASLQYHLTDATLGYVSFNHGFKEGNVNIVAGKASFIQPETINTYELGIKSDITRQFRVDGDIFLNKLSNMQVAGVDPNFYNFPIISNAAKATTYGLELEATARPLPDLNLSANYGYLHAVFDDYYVLSVFAPAPNFPGVLVNASGNPIPLAPRNTLSLQAEYTIHLASYGSIAPRINYSFKSEQAFTAEGFNPEASQKGYGLLGAGLKYASADRLEIDLWGRNLTNKAYLVDVQPSDSFNGTTFPTYGQPRMYGVTLTKKF